MVGLEELIRRRQAPTRVLVVSPRGTRTTDPQADGQATRSVEALRRLGFCVRAVSAESNAWHDRLGAMRALLGARWSQQPDAVVILDPARQTKRALAAVTRAGRTRVIIGLPAGSAEPMRRLPAPLLRRLLARADVIAAATPEDAEQFPGVATHYPWGAVDSARFRAPLDLDQIQQAGEEQLLLGCIIEDSPLDAVQVIDAFARVARRLGRRRVRLELAAPQTRIPALRHAARELALVSEIRFRGPVAPARRAAFMAGLHGLIQPSVAPGLPAASLEAMACAVPVLGPCLPGDAFLRCGFNGQSYVADDGQSLAEAIVRLAQLGPAERTWIARQARKTALAYASEQHDAVLHSIVTGKAPATTDRHRLVA